MQTKALQGSRRGSDRPKFGPKAGTVNRTPRRPKLPSGRRQCDNRNAFASNIAPSRKSGTTRSVQERIIFDLLAPEYNCGIEAVSFQVRRTGPKNGTVGVKIPDIYLVTEVGVIFIELSAMFSPEELKALEFIRSHYGLTVLAITNDEADAMFKEPQLLLGRIEEEIHRLSALGANRYTPRILAAIRATTAARARKSESPKGRDRGQDPAKGRNKSPTTGPPTRQEPAGPGRQELHFGKPHSQRGAAEAAAKLNLRRGDE